MTSHQKPLPTKLLCGERHLFLNLTNSDFNTSSASEQRHCGLHSQAATRGRKRWVCNKAQQEPRGAPRGCSRAESSCTDPASQQVAISKCLLCVQPVARAKGAQEVPCLLLGCQAGPVPSSSCRIQHSGMWVSARLKKVMLQGASR